MSRVELAPLIAESAAHALAQSARPFRTRLGNEPDIEPDRRVHVPHAECGNYQKHNQRARYQKRWIEVDLLLVDVRHFVRPPEYVVASDEKNQRQQNPRHRQKRDVALEKSYDRSRPPRRCNTLHRDEHHAGGRDRREIKPVDQQCLPRTIGLHKESDYKNDRSDGGKNQSDQFERARRRPIGAGQNLLARRDMDVVRAHGLAPVGVVDAGPARGVWPAGVGLAGVCAALSTGAPCAAAVSRVAEAPGTDGPRGDMNGAGLVGPICDGPGSLSPVTPGAASGPTATVRPPAPCNPRT